MDNNTFSRLQDEELTLNAKIICLRDFINSEMFEELDDLEKGLLLEQIYRMREYSEILGMRIWREIERE